MKPNELAAAVEMLLSGEHAEWKERDLRLARETSALPVYADWTTTLLLAPDGRVFAFDEESRVLSEVHDERHKTLAVVAASERYASLAALRPARPTDARTCDLCNGLGKIERSVRCGQCMGLGWT